MEAERNRRENELNTLAHIRTAEGDKSSAILKSEGVLVAAENEAQGQFVRVTKQAEAEALERELQAAAMKKQIDLLATALGSPAAAAQFLIETQRLQHLRAVAEGKNSKVYFVSPDGNLPTASNADISSAISSARISAAAGSSTAVTSAIAAVPTGEIITGMLKA